MELTIQESCAALLAIADEQQKTVEGLIAQAKNQRQLLADELTKAAPKLSDSVREAISRELVGSSKFAADAVDLGLRPHLSKLAAAGAEARDAAELVSGVAERLKAWPAAFAWCCAAILMLTGAGLWAFVAWERGEVTELRAERAAITRELAELHAQRLAEASAPQERSRRRK